MESALDWFDRFLQTATRVHGKVCPQLLSQQNCTQSSRRESCGVELCACCWDCSKQGQKRKKLHDTTSTPSISHFPYPLLHLTVDVDGSESTRTRKRSWVKACRDSKMVFPQRRQTFSSENTGEGGGLSKQTDVGCGALKDSTCMLKSGRLYRAQSTIPAGCI